MKKSCHHSPLFRVFSELLVVLLSIFLLLLFLRFNSHVPFSQLLSGLFQYFYAPRYHMISGAGLFGVPMHVLVVIVVLFSTLGILLLRDQRNNPETSRRERVRSAAMTSCFIIAVIFMIFKTVGYSLFFSILHDKFAGLNIHERRTLIFGYLYRFPLFCKQYFSGKSYGTLITDKQLASEAGAREHTIMAYFLYPLELQPNPRQKFLTEQIEAPRDRKYLIIYHVANPAEILGPDTKILGQYRPSKLIAVREPPEL